MKKEERKRPRLSIMPARAVLDSNISAQALRVLALLGCHTDDDGWCRRSQVRMADELGVARGTIQNALAELMPSYVERREETRPGVRPEEGRHPHCSYSYRVRLDLEDEADGGANRMAPMVPTGKQGVPTQEKHGVPASLAPLTERPLGNDPLGNADARDGDWPEVWAAFLTWPNLPDTASEARTMAVWGRMRDQLPPKAALIRTIHAQGARLRAGQKRGGWATAPHNWLERDRGWADHAAIAARDASLEADLAQRRDRIITELGADVLAKLRRAGMRESEIGALDGVAFEPGPLPAFHARGYAATILSKYASRLDDLLPGVRVIRSDIARRA